MTIASVAQLVEQGTENPRVVGSIPTGGTICGFSSSGRAPPCQGGGSEFEPRNPLHIRTPNAFGAAEFVIRRYSQVVRQGSAKPSFPSSNLGGASTRKGLLFKFVKFFWKFKFFFKKPLDKSKEKWYNNQVAARELLKPRGKRVDSGRHLFLENWTIWRTNYDLVDSGFSDKQFGRLMRKNNNFG